MLTSRELKNRAWAQLGGGAWLPAIAGFALLFLLLTMVRSGLERYGVSQGWIQEMKLGDLLRPFVGDAELPASYMQSVVRKPELWYQTVMYLMLLFWQGVLDFGGAVLAIAVMRGGVHGMLAFSGFSRVLRTGWLGLLKGVRIMLWSLLLVVPGVMAAYSYRMAFFLLSDHPEWSAGRALAESKRMMCGHRMRLAWLDCSFVLWYLLVAVTGGLAAALVNPYAETAFAAFYEDLLDREESEAEAV